MFKKISLFCIILWLLVLSSIYSVYAYQPPLSLDVNINRNEMPQGTAYMDLLIPIHNNDENFVQQKDNIDIVFNIFDSSLLDIQSTSEIALYNNGYYSYLFHFKDSTIDITEYQDTLHVTYGFSQRLLEDIVRLKNCKFAFVDAEGNILECTEDFVIKEHFFKDFREIIITETSVSVKYYINPYRIAFAIILVSAMIIVCIIIAMKVKKIRQSGDG